MSGVLVTGYDDVRALLDDPRLTPDRLHGFAERAPAAAVEAVRRHAPWLLQPNGAGYEWIGPVVREALRAPRTLPAADALLDDLLPRGGFDAVSDYAFPLSASAVADFLGVGRNDGERLVAWGLDIVLFFTSAEITVERTERMALAIDALVVRARELAGADDGFLPRAGRAAAERGLALDDASLASITLPLVTGYVDAAHLTAVSIELLLRHDDQRALLQAEPRLVTGAVAEGLRLGAPVALVPRTALEPVAVDGHVIAPGQRALLSLAAANRDPIRFPQPDRFDIRRSQRGALGFGHGRGRCVAASLARAHVAAALEALGRRAPQLALDRPPVWRPIAGINALQSLAVVVGA